MANELVPLHARRPASRRSGRRRRRRKPPLPSVTASTKFFYPLVAAGYVDTDEETAGGGSGTCRRRTPPPWQGYEAARQARRAAVRGRARTRNTPAGHGLPGYAALREADAADNRQQGWGDWGDVRTWAIIAAMFFGFLLFVAFVYFSPTGRHNQNDGPLSVPAFRGY